MGDTVAIQFAPMEGRAGANRAACAASAWWNAPAGKAGVPGVREVWSDITPAARRDWIHWIESAKQAETCAKRAW